MSQIFTEDAIGAVMRGNQLVVAGDEKQLHPTSFFQATANDAEIEMGVRWVPVHDGVYDGGKSRTNAREADAIPGREVSKRAVILLGKIADFRRIQSMEILGVSGKEIPFEFKSVPLP